MAANWTQRQMLEHAARAIGKVDLHGLRGASLVSMDEIIAMATTLASFGLVPIFPGDPVPEALVAWWADPPRWVQDTTAPETLIIPQS